MIDGFCDNLLGFAYTQCVGAQLQKPNSSWLCCSLSCFDALMNRFAKRKLAYIEYVLVHQVYKSQYSNMLFLTIIPVNAHFWTASITSLPTVFALWSNDRMKDFLYCKILFWYRYIEETYTMMTVFFINLVQFRHNLSSEGSRYKSL
mgnify:CR=1 FL=1